MQFALISVEIWKSVTYNDLKLAHPLGRSYVTLNLEKAFNDCLYSAYASASISTNLCR